MDETEIKHVVEAALLAAGRPLTLDRLALLFTARGSGPDRDTLRRTIDALATDYQGRGIELKEVASGWRVQVKRTMSDWLAPLWEERAPRYTRALLETLALIAYRQPITRAEIEEVRGVVVSTNIVRTLLERNWVRVVGHRDVPGKPAMFGTTREFLDYFGLKKLEDLPPLAELKDGMPELSPQADLIESLEEAARIVDAEVEEPAVVALADFRPSGGEPGTSASSVETAAAGDEPGDDDDDDDDLDSPDILDDEEDYEDEDVDDEDEDEDADEDDDDEDDDDEDDDDDRDEDDEDDEDDDYDDEDDDRDDDDESDEYETEDRVVEAAPAAEPEPRAVRALTPSSDPASAGESEESETADVIPLRARASGDGSD
jgi:segregation and condensation protein B